MTAGRRLAPALGLAAALMGASAAHAQFPPAGAWATPVEDPLAAALGVRPSARTRASTRVVNGIEAAEGAYPFLTLLEFETPSGRVLGCGGFQIAPEWIMTAAHCVVKGDSADDPRGRVEAARMVALRGSVAPGNAERLRIAEVVPHPDYNRPHGAYNDIALLRLEAPVDRPRVMLPPATVDPPAGTGVIIVGWGDTYFGAETGSERLREARTDLVGRAECQAVHDLVRDQIRREKNPDYVGNGPIDRTRICARVENSARPVDSCHGDSGGPLLAPTPRGMIAIGIVSYGYGCAQPGIHGVYTNVAAYRDWIERVTGLRRFDGGSPHDGGGGGGDLTEIAAVETEASVRLSVRSGPQVRPGDRVVFDVESSIDGALLLLQAGPKGELIQIFPNHRTERGRIAPLVRAGRRFSTPARNHGYVFEARPERGDYAVFAVVLGGARTRADLGFARARTRGLAPIAAARDYLADAAAQLKAACEERGVTCGIAATRLTVE